MEGDLFVLGDEMNEANKDWSINACGGKAKGGKNGKGKGSYYSCTKP